MDPALRHANHAATRCAGHAPRTFPHELARFSEQRRHARANLLRLIRGDWLVALADILVRGMQPRGDIVEVCEPNALDGIQGRVRSVELAQRATTDPRAVEVARDGEERDPLGRRDAAIVVHAMCVLSGHGWGESYVEPTLDIYSSARPPFV
jgi:hypothetical protein